jgi:hypothetical protein
MAKRSGPKKNKRTTALGPRLLPASVVLMLLGMGYHLWVLNDGMGPLALAFLGVCALFIVYDRLLPLADAAQEQP